MKINCIQLRDTIENEIKQEVELLKKGGVTPCFAIIQVGNYPPSDTYVRVKMKKAKELGIDVKIFKFSQVQNSKIKNQNIELDSRLRGNDSATGIRKNPLEIRMNQLRTQKDIEKLIDQLNKNPSIHGIIIQRPLPATMDETHLQSLINPQKDIDGLSPNSPFKNPLVSAVEHVVNHILSVGVRHGEPLQLNKLQLVVIGKGRTAGKPIYEYFTSHPVIPAPPSVIPAKAGIQLSLSVSQIDSQTPNPDLILRKADIIISCVGKPTVVRRDNIKKGAVLISVGQHQSRRGGINSKWVGDYDEDKIKDVAAAHTPTPRGIGPLNVIFLLKNVIIATNDKPR